MADKKIEDATRVASVGGTEILPASVGGAAKSLTTEQVKTYVMDAIATLSDITDWEPESGEAMAIRTTVDNATVNRYVPFDDVVLAVFNALVGKTAVTTLSDEDVISISNGSDAKTVTVGVLKTHVSNAFSGNMDIHGLTAADSAGAGDELAAYQAGSVSANRKVTVSQLATAVCPKVATEATASQTALSSTDALIIARAPATPGGSPTLEKVPLQSSGLPATSSVTGPNATTVGKIPKWDSTTRALGDGMSVVTSVGSSSLDTSIPTAKAVHDATTSATSGKVTGPSSSSDGDIAQFYGTTGKLLKGGVSITSSISATPSPSKIPNEFAVKTELDSCVKSNQNTRTEGCVPRWGSDGTLASQLEVCTSISSSQVDKLPTNNAVYNALQDKISKPQNTTENKIPQWDSVNGVLKDGLTVSSSVSAVPSDIRVLTELAVSTELEAKVTAPSITTENRIPQWDHDSKTLKDGLTVDSSITSASTGVPRTSVVNTELGKKVEAPDSTTQNKIPQWDSTSKKLKDGLSVATGISASPVDTNIPTEKAVSDFVDERMITVPATTTEDNIPLWGSSNSELKAGMSVATSVSGISTDYQIPTAKAVNDAISTKAGKQSGSELTSGVATWTASGLLDKREMQTAAIAANTDGGKIPSVSCLRLSLEHHQTAAVVDSGRPSSSLNAKTGVLYYSTSQSELYINTGTAGSCVWVKLCTAP